MSSTADLFTQKTDAELRFFVENPSFYAEELVAAAQRELRRRGALAAPAVPPGAEQPTAAPLPAQPAEVFDEYADVPRRSRAPWLLLLLALALGGTYFFYYQKSQRPASAAAPEPAPASASASEPRLVAVESHPMPDFDAATRASVERQQALVPAAEKKNAQALRQYRELSRRFWAAEHPSAYLYAQAASGHPGPTFAGQAQLALDQWQELAKALVYSYQLGPTMSRQLVCMSRAAILRRGQLTRLQARAGGDGSQPLIEPSDRADNDSVRALLVPLLRRPATNDAGGVTTTINPS